MAATLSGAFKTLVAAALEAGAASASANQAAILLAAHTKATAPLAAQAAAVIGEAIPGGGFPWSEIEGGIKAKLPVFEAQLTQALDTRAGLLLAWGIGTAQKWAKTLES